MPNVTLHLLLAERTREGWAASPKDAPFPPEDRVLIRAFRTGAFGPDMGYVPGGDRALSDLAHCVRSGDLARAILKGATTPLERAFAWGWVTHVVADRMVHPLVGRAVSELRTGRPEGFISGAEDPEGHVQVETGLDAWISHLHPPLRQARPAPVLAHDSTRLLRDAYHRVYGVELDPMVLLELQRNLATRAGQALAGMSLLGGDLRRARGGSFVVRALSGFAGFALERLGDGALTMAYLNPVSPPAWLRIEVASVVEAFPGRIAAVSSAPELHLPNVNLDTGVPDERSETHPNRIRALAALERLRAAPAGAPVSTAGPISVDAPPLASRVRS